MKMQLMSKALPGMMMMMTLPGTLKKLIVTIKKFKMKMTMAKYMKTQGHTWKEKTSGKNQRE